jgi:hypothetical protein
MATSAFGKAFAEARKAGDKEFSFNGKLYTTAMKGEKKAPGGREPVHIDAEAGMTRGRNDYVTSGKKSFDTETEFVPPDMSSSKSRRESKPMTEVSKPGTRTNYENMDTSDMSMKRGGSVKKMASGGMARSASSRGDGIAMRGKTKGTMVMCGGGMARKK